MYPAHTSVRALISHKLVSYESSSWRVRALSWSSLDTRYFAQGMKHSRHLINIYRLNHWGDPLPVQKTTCHITVQSLVSLLCLACLGCYEKYHRQRDLSNRHLFSHSSEGWKSNMRVLAWSGSDEGSLPSLLMASFLLCPHMVGKEMSGGGGVCKLSGIFSYKHTNPTMRTPPSWAHLILIISKVPISP